MATRGGVVSMDIEEDVGRTSPWNVYFMVSSKEGLASLDIEHPLQQQALQIPVFPRCGIAEALPLLEPGFAHYAAQWERIMVPDPEEADTRGFLIEASELPGPIADARHKRALDDIFIRHVPDFVVRFFEGHYPAFRLNIDLSMVARSNTQDVCMPPGVLGIEPWGGPVQT